MAKIRNYGKLITKLHTTLLSDSVRSYRPYRFAWICTLSIGGCGGTFHYHSNPPVVYKGPRLEVYPPPLAKPSLHGGPDYKRVGYLWYFNSHVTVWFIGLNTRYNILATVSLPACSHTSFTATVGCK